MGLRLFAFSVFGAIITLECNSSDWGGVKLCGRMKCVNIGFSQQKSGHILTQKVKIARFLLFELLHLGVIIGNYYV
jgi:hypothetical protein